jgi:CheY-like chemotaxis protein
VALTASAFEHERAEILSYGVDDFVAKPFREETIFGKLAEHLGTRFVYEEVDEDEEAEEAVEEGEGALTAGRLAALPDGRVRELYSVLANGDITAAASTATLIRDEDDEQLGSALLVEIRAFRIDELLSLLEGLEHTA